MREQEEEENKRGEEDAADESPPRAKRTQHNDPSFKFDRQYGLASWVAGSESHRHS